MHSQQVLSSLATIFPHKSAYAHCDLPCGIYDPHRAILASLTVLRMMDVLQDHASHIQEAAQTHTDDFELRNNFIRGVLVKEEHAEIVKSEIRTIWGDYCKPEHKTQFPELDTLVFDIMHMASKTKQTLDRNAAETLLEKVNQFATIFWKTKGIETKTVKAPYKPEANIVIPIL